MTGRVVLQESPNCKAATSKARILELIEPGSLLLTDRHRSCRWLAAFWVVHRAVNHEGRAFSRVEIIYGQRITVSTNTAEGLFGNLKTFVRSFGIKKLGSKAYGALMAEF